MVVSGRARSTRRADAWLAVACLAACSGCGGADAPTPSRVAPLRVLGEKRLGPRLQEWRLRTGALREPTRVRVLLPAGYAHHRAQRYPVLFLLHGRDADFRAWTRFGNARALTARYPLIVVMPDGGPAATYTNFYRDGRSVLPRWETYHVEQLVPWVQRRFRTVPGRRGRAIAGLSLGGFGALSYAGRHPRLFVAAASFSGALEVGSTEAWGAYADHQARWRAHLPIDLAPRLRALALVVLSTGDGRPGPLDPPGLSPACAACQLERRLYPANLRLHERLARLRIRHVFDDYGAGTHDWPYWQRDLRRTLPGLVRVLRSRRG